MRVTDSQAATFATRRVSDERLEWILSKMPTGGVSLDLLDALRWQVCLDLRDERQAHAETQAAFGHVVRLLDAISAWTEGAYEKPEWAEHIVRILSTPRAVAVLREGR
jgi:hypothetical protein